MSWKKLSTDYFTFTRKERIGLLAIVVLILGIWIFPKIAASGKPETVVADTAWMSAAAKLKLQSADDSKAHDENIDALTVDRRDNSNSDKARNQLFFFDPNTLSVEGWKKLGIREKTAITIQKYLSKGGHFYRAEDLKKIYGIHPSDYERLEPCVKIETQTSEGIGSHSKEMRLANTAKYQSIDVNSADTSAFISLPGIGSKLASRIVNFRDKLGGFYSIDQIRETYGLADSTFQKIKPLLVVGNISIKKINVNTATKDEMKSHPYIRWNLANAIVEYRNQHGSFSSLEDLKSISAITDEVFNRIKFYLATE